MCLSQEGFFFKLPDENLNVRKEKRKAETIEDENDKPSAKTRRTEVYLDYLNFIRLGHLISTGISTLQNQQLKGIKIN